MSIYMYILYLQYYSCYRLLVGRANRIPPQKTCPAPTDSLVYPDSHSQETQKDVVVGAIHRLAKIAIFTTNSDPELTLCLYEILTLN